MRTRMQLTAGLATTAAAAICAASAFASGGTTVAAAPAVPVGQQQFGDTSKVPRNSAGYSQEFWKLVLRAGDRVRIDWEENAGVQVRLYVYPPTTTDYTIGSTQWRWEEPAAANGRNELTFTAPTSGTWPIAFASAAIASETPGPYDFVAFVQHEARLFLPALSSLGRHSIIRVGVHAPDGTPISDGSLALRLEASWRGSWHSLATAVPRAGVARFRVAVPSGVSGRILMRVRASGATYIPALSAERGVVIH